MVKKLFAIDIFIVQTYIFYDCSHIKQYPQNQNHKLLATTCNYYCCLKYLLQEFQLILLSFKLFDLGGGLTILDVFQKHLSGIDKIVLKAALKLGSDLGKGQYNQTPILITIIKIHFAKHGENGNWAIITCLIGVFFFSHLSFHKPMDVSYLKEKQRPSVSIVLASQIRHR